MIHPLGPGTYVLVMRLHETTTIDVGRLGALAFEPGWYLYVGSALGGLEARLARHLRAEKRLHWHIDYFLRHARIELIWYREGRERLECGWARTLAQTPGVQPVAPGFGASDCACRTHLFYSATPQPALPGCGVIEPSCSERS